MARVTVPPPVALLPTAMPAGPLAPGVTVFHATVSLTMSTLAPPVTPTPAPALAESPVSVSSVSVTVPPCTNTPPPSVPAASFDSRLPLTTVVLLSLRIPPPRNPVLPEMLSPLRVTCAPLYTSTPPPPASGALAGAVLAVDAPPVIVMPEMVTLPPSTANTGPALPPLTVTFSTPSPAIVRLARPSVWVIDRFSS